MANDKPSADSSSSNRADLLRRMVHGFRNDLHRIDDERFHSALDRFQTERYRHPDVKGSSSLQHADRQITIAREHWTNGEREAAWTAVKGADRELVVLLDDVDLEIEQQRVLAEARDKLTGWRRSIVEQLLTTPSSGATQIEKRPHDELIRRVRTARRVLDDHMDNVYLRMQLLRGHLRRAGAMLLITLLVTGLILGLALEAEWRPNSAQDPFADLRSFVVVAALGAFGAAVSGAVRFMARDAEWKIPQLKAERVLIWLRPIVGAAAAIVVVGLLASGLGGLRMNADAALAIALISGFSEALVSRAVTQASASITR